MQNLHNKLAKKYSWYHAWHNQPKMQTLQWLVLLLVVASVALLFVNRINTPEEDKRLVSMQSLADFASLPDSAFECLQRTGTRVTLTGAQQNYYQNNSLANNTVVNSKTASWTSSMAKPLRVGGGSEICVGGGTITGTFPLSTDWSTMHDTYAVELRGQNALVERLRIHNYGDGVAMWENANNFSIKKVHMSQIRDDCVSNDHGWSGLLEDSFLDGCYVAFSDRSWSAADPSAVWTIRNNVVRLQSYDQTYRVGESGHGWFWKMDSGDAAVKVDLHGNVFRADQPSMHSNHVFRADKVASCKKPDGSPDNVIVWLGSGVYPRPEELASGCFALTTDRAVWDAAVTAWSNRTQSNGQVIPAPTASFSVSPSTITAGQSAILSWTSTDAASLSISPSVGSVTPVAAGTKVVTPTSTTTYTLTVAGANGSTITKTATVTVNPIQTYSHITLNPTALNFSAISGTTAPAAQSVTLSNTGTASMSWIATDNQDWCGVTPSSGSLAASGSTVLKVSVSAPSNVGTFACDITVTAANADNTPQSLKVNYTVQGTTTAPTTSLRFKSIADAMIDLKNATSPNGSSSGFGADANKGIAERIGLVKFNVQNSTKPIVRAALRLYVTDSSSGGVEIYKSDTSWSESTVTWNIRPTYWGSSVNSGRTRSGRWVELNVTGAVTGNGEYSFTLLPNNDDSAYFSTKEGKAAPELVLYY